MNEMKPLPQSPQSSQQYLDQLSEAKHVRYDIKTGKVVEETNALKILFEKAKGLLGFTSTTDKDLLAHKIFVYLENNTDLHTAQNLQKILKICEHAGVINGHDDKNSPIQQKLADKTKEISNAIANQPPPPQKTPSSQATTPQAPPKTKQPTDSDSSEDIFYDAETGEEPSSLKGRVTPDQTASPAIDKTRQSTIPKAKITKAFSELSSYIKEKYPDFDMEPYRSVEDMQKTGHPFHFAVVNSDPKLINLLVKAGGNIHQLDAEGNNLLTFLSKELILNPQENSLKKQNSDILLLSYRLINLGFDPKQSNSLGQNALQELVLHIDSGQGQNEALKNILLPFFDVIDDTNRNAAIALLHSTKDPDILVYLVSKGLDVNTPDDRGRTALWFAVQQSDIGLVRDLIQLGANPSLSPEQVDGKKSLVSSPLELARTEKANVERLIRNLSMAKDSVYHPKVPKKPFQEPKENVKQGVLALRAEQAKAKANPIKALTPNPRAGSMPVKDVFAEETEVKEGRKPPAEPRKFTPEEGGQVFATIERKQAWIPGPIINQAQIKLRTIDLVIKALESAATET